MVHKQTLTYSVDREVYIKLKLCQLLRILMVCFIIDSRII